MRAFLLVSLSCLVACRVEVSSLDERLNDTLEAQGVGPLGIPKQDPALVFLGEKLFFDKILSGNKDLSCSGCHHPTLKSCDSIPLSIGTNGDGLGPTRKTLGVAFRTPRNSPEIFNRGAGLWSTMFWDGRVERLPTGELLTPAQDQLFASIDSPLEAQAMFPVLSREEMRGQSGDLDINGEVNELALLPDDNPRLIWDALLARLLEIPRYVELFEAAYPGVESFDFGHAAKAIAAYETDAFFLNESPFDRYLAGDLFAMSDEQKRGALLFFGKARCASCHSGSLLTDQKYHNLAVPVISLDGAAIDQGRGGFAFRTPPLRNVTVTGPWMHNGAYSSLEQAIAHHFDPEGSLRQYDPSQLGAELQDSFVGDEATLTALLSSLDPKLPSPALSSTELNELIAFLEALEDPDARLQFTIIPETVPSGLSTSY